ncbi:hypothetical protein [Paenibacillus xanthanilyticus]|uniref:Glycosyl hydrolase n=1 Tax=Paenibacillus xanthanilyticus TaxID=1783531 RepID=A0ABV8JVJ4_9BACL
MFKFASKKTIALIAAIVAVVIAGGTWLELNAGARAPEVKVTAAKDGQLLTFIYRHLVDPYDGGVYTNLRDDLPPLPDTARNHDKLSESTGLLLDYAVSRKRQDIYLNQLFFLENELVADSMLIRWMTDDEHKRRITVNASIDDLRIIRALLEGAEQFGRDGDRQLAIKLSDQLYRAGRSQSWLADYYDARDGYIASTITASYLDVYTLNLLAGLNPKWKPIAAASQKLLGESLQANGLFLKTYDIPSRTWQKPTAGFNLIDVLISAVHWAEAGGDAEATVNWLKKKWQRDQRLYSVYMANGTVVNSNESPAVYALGVQLLELTGKETALTEKFKTRMRAFAVHDSSSPYVGGYVSLDDRSSYSFDNLQALLID